MAGRTLEMVKLAEGRQVSAVEICGADRLWDGEMDCFRAGNTTILLVKIDGQFHAYQGHCPHQGAALAEGELDGGLITCSAHRWQFNATNGLGVNPMSARLKCFPVHVVERKVLIEMELDGAEEPDNFVGPVIRAGDFADVVVQSIEDDNPGKEVRIVDHGDYVRIHTAQVCRLSRKALERHLGHPYEMRMLEIEMPSFCGRLKTRDDEFVWYYDN